MNRLANTSNLSIRATSGAEVQKIEGGWRFGVQAGEAGSYRLAQLDDYASLARSKFPHRAPFTLSLRARSSAAEIPGTWGFGLWNDPFGLLLGFGGKRGRLPALPNAAWFFFASPENHLSLRDDQPGHGALAAVFRSPRPPGWLLAPAVLAIPLLPIRPLSRIFRKAASRLISSNTQQIALDPSLWHQYSIAWGEGGVIFATDDAVPFTSAMVPQGPLGLVVWIDNQYAAWRPDGRFGVGTLATPQDCWVEITDLQILPH